MLENRCEDTAATRRRAFPDHRTGFAGNAFLRLTGEQRQECRRISARFPGNARKGLVVPRASAASALELAQEMDFKEHSMYATIEKLKSIPEAVNQFGRL